MLFSLLGLEKDTVLKLISWKHSFKRLNEEYEIAKKKKQALDNLFESGRISQATRDSFDNDINAVITEIEKQQKDLLVKMQGKAQELESQLKTLETLLANYEIQHVVGKIEEVQNEPVENIPSPPAEVEVNTEPCAQEPAVTIEEAVPEQPKIECENTVSAEMPQEAEEAPQEIVEQPQATEETIQTVEETVEAIENKPEVTEDVPPVMDEMTEGIADNPENTEEIPEEIEIQPQPIVETPNVLEDEPQEVEVTPQLMEDMPEEAHPPHAPKEAPQEITVEAAADEEQEAAETAASAEADENNENQDTY